MSEKHTPGSWRWGFWKWHKDTREREFRPIKEMVDRDGDTLVLANCEYGRRHCRLVEESTLPSVIEGDARDDGEGASICIGDADMALVAGAPDLLEACKELLLLAECYEDKAQTYSSDYITSNEVVKARAAIAKAEGVTT